MTGAQGIVISESSSDGGAGTAEHLSIPHPHTRTAEHDLGHGVKYDPGIKHGLGIISESVNGAQSIVICHT